MNVVTFLRRILYNSDINANISSSSQQSVRSNEEDVSDNSGMQHGTWTKLGAGQPHFPFSGKPGLNVGFKDPTNPLEYF
jgi:hypothetical protein